MALLISEEVYFRVKNITKDKHDHFKTRMETVHPEDTIVIHNHAPDHISEGKMDRTARGNEQSTIVLRNFNRLLCLWDPKESDLTEQLSMHACTQP